MKKILLSLALLATVVSCQKIELNDSELAVEKNLKTVSVGVSTKNNASNTKVGITTGEKVWDIKWTKGDKIGGHSFTYDDVSGWDTTLYPFEMTTDLSSEDAEYAEFSGTINVAKEKQRFIYPYKNIKCTGGMPYLYLTKQTVDMKAPMANLSNYVYMVSEDIYNTSDADFGEIKMKHISSVLNLDINFINIPESGAKLKKVKILGMGDTHLNFGIQYDFKQEYQTEASGVTRTSAMKFKDAVNQSREESEITIENSPKLSADNSYSVPVAMFPVRFYEATSGKDEVLNITITYTVGDDEVEDEREVIVTWGDRSGTFSDLMRGGVQPMSITCDLAEKKAPEVPDFTDPNGVFFLFEGNMTNSWGKIVYIDAEGTEWKDVFTMQNKGKVVGNVLQDIYIYKDRIYLLCQNGRDLGNGGAPSSNACGRLVVCDKNMKMLYADDLDIVSQAGDETWPQHLAIVNDKVYVQYSEVMEDYSGVYVLDIDEDGEGVTFNSYINDTFGVFTKTGATKARMVVSGDKIYMGRGTSFISISTAENDAVTVIKDFKSEENADDQGSQVKDVVKTKDGDFYVAVSGEGTTEQWAEVMTTPSKIVCISKDGKIKSETELTKLNWNTYTYEFDPAIGFPINPASPNIGMCTSFKSNNFIFREQAQFMCTTVGQISEDSYSGKLSYKENPLYIYDSYAPIYGYAGIANDEDETLYVGTSDSYTSGTITVYGPDGYGGYYNTGKKYEYNDMDHASPAGIDFGYRFTTEWINK